MVQYQSCFQGAITSPNLFLHLFEYLSFDFQLTRSFWLMVCFWCCSIQSWQVKEEPKWSESRQEQHSSCFDYSIPRHFRSTDMSRSWVCLSIPSNATLKMSRFAVQQTCTNIQYFAGCRRRSNTLSHHSFPNCDSNSSIDLNLWGRMWPSP